MSLEDGKNSSAIDARLINRPMELTLSGTLFSIRIVLRIWKLRQIKKIPKWRYIIKTQVI